MQLNKRISEWKKYWILIPDQSSADVTDVVTGHNFVRMEKHRSQQGETKTYTRSIATTWQNIRRQTNT